MNPHLPPLRADLQLVESAPGINGAPQWVLSDPITGRYFTLTPSAIRLLRHWPLRQPQQILAAANSEPGLPLRVKELEKLLQFLRQHDLVAASDAEQRQRYLGKAQAMRTSLWKSVLHQYLFFRHSSVATRSGTQPLLAVATALWCALSDLGLSIRPAAGFIFGQSRLGTLHPFVSTPLQPVWHGRVRCLSGVRQIYP